MNLFVCLQIWTVASLIITYKQLRQKRVSEFFLSKYFFSESDFCTITPHFFILFQKCSFHCDWIWQNADTVFFSALGLESEEQTKLAKTKIRFDL